MWCGWISFWTELFTGYKTKALWHHESEGQRHSLGKPPSWIILARLVFTCDDVDIGIRVFTQLHGTAVSLKRLAQLLLHGRRSAEPVKPHHLHTDTRVGQVKTTLGGDDTENPRVLQTGRLSRPFDETWPIYSHYTHLIFYLSSAYYCYFFILSTLLWRQILKEESLSSLLSLILRLWVDEFHVWL